MEKRILLIEDDAPLAKSIVAALRRAGYAVTLATDGDAGLVTALSESPDLIVLDMLLPGRSGSTVLEALRHRSSVPVLVLTALTDLQTRLAAFDLGAADYLAKPFFTEELLARVDARLREKRTQPPRLVRWSGVCVDLDGRRVTRDGSDIAMTANEFNVLAYLVQRPDRSVTRRQLADGALSVDGMAADRTVDSHIARIRKKLGEAAGAVETVWSIGYRFRAPP